MIFQTPELTLEDRTVLDEIHATRAELAEPAWPAKTFGDLLKVAFRDRFIDSIDHPVLKRLRGEA